MKQLLDISQVQKLALHISRSQQSLCLVGGCFDILHLGHITFLEAAKSSADILVVLLESDQNIKRLKGPNRPINSQINRAKLLSALKMVDYLILLPETTKDLDYDRLVQQLKPQVIATTIPDPQIHHKIRQAKLVNAKLLKIQHLAEKSTSRIEQIISQEL